MDKSSLNVGMYIIDENHRILYYNEAAGELYPELKTGDVCYRALGCLDAPCRHCPIKEGTEQESVFYNEARKEWISASVASMDIPGHGRCHNVQFRVRTKEPDIADLPFAQRNAAIVAEFVQQSEKAGIIGGYCEEGFPLYYANEQMAALLGYDSVEDLAAGIGGKVVNTIHPDALPRVRQELGDRYYPGMTYRTTYRMPRKDGSWFWTVDRGKVVEAEDGRLAIISICSDMKELVEYQRDLQRQNEHLIRRESFSAAALDNMPGGYHRCSVEEGFPFTYISDRFAQMLGWSKEEIATLFDNRYANLLHPDDAKALEVYRQMARHVGRGNVYDERITRLKGKDGYRWIQNTTMLVDLGADSFFQGTIADITDHVEKETSQQEELNRAIRRAELASKAKSTFLFNMSHDIRTPMNAIMGFAALADLRYREPEAVKDYMRKIKRSSDLLMRIINDVLDLARIESGKFILEAKPQDLRDGMQGVKDMFAESMARAGLRFITETQISDPVVLCDDLRMNQICINLLSNAQKFTPAGGSVLLRLEQTSPAGGKEAEYLLTVRDTGIGMEPEFLTHIFDVFERERSSTVTGIAGTGLGLSIVKNLVNMMGGSISVKSKKGEGSEFSVRFTFPVATRTEAAQVVRYNADPTDFSGRHLLVVEDNELNREIAREILVNMGFSVDVAANGADATDMVARLAPERYDLILMDVQMPKTDGYEATRIIRKMKDAQAANTPIVAMTANAFEEDRQAALAAGMDGHVAKPIDIEQLKRELSRLL